MNNNIDQKSNFLSEEEAKGWDFYFAVGVQCTQDLRQHLGLNESSFRRLGPHVNGEPKKYFVFRMLDEMQKAALKIYYWKQYVSEEDIAKCERIDFETLIDDQQFRSRKLTELLVDAILFSTTDDQAHFGDYLLLHELNECARSQEDRNEFFGFYNKNASWEADWRYKEIQSLENAGLNPKSRWYIKQSQALSQDWKTKGVPFSSFRHRYKEILKCAFPSELVVLGKSYLDAYGMSKDVHFTPHDTSSSFSVEEFRLGVDKVGLLILALVIRCQHLLGFVPDGLNKVYREMHDGNAGPQKLTQSLRTKPADEGDVVWVHGHYAEVLAVKVSKYGYPAYQVRYLEPPPLAEVPEDWFAGFEVRLVAKKSQIEQAADDLAEEITKAVGNLQTRETLLNYAKQGIIRLSRHMQQAHQQRMVEANALNSNAPKSDSPN